jgi:hypothetical protein
MLPGGLAQGLAVIKKTALSSWLERGGKVVNTSGFQAAAHTKATTVNQGIKREHEIVTWYLKKREKCIKGIKRRQNSRSNMNKTWPISCKYNPQSGIRAHG